MKTLARIVLSTAAALAASLLCASPGFAGPGKIVYTNGPNGQVVLINSDGTGRTPLTTNFLAGEPALSPDGQWVAFQGSNTISGPPFEEGIWLMKAEPMSATNVPVRVVNGTSYGFRMSWHPNGRWLAFTIGANSQIFVLSVLDANGQVTPESAGNAKTEVTTNTFNFSEDPAFSPDGRYLAYASQYHYLKLLRVTDDSGNLTPEGAGNTATIVSLNGADDPYAYRPSWNHDGTKLVFEHVRYSSGLTNPFSSIAVLTVRDGSGNITPEHATTNPRVLLFQAEAGARMFRSPTWSPDGSLIACVPPAISPDNPGVFKINASGPEHVVNNPRVRISPTNEVGSSPSFAQPGGVLVDNTPASALGDAIAWWPAENAPVDVVGGQHGSFQNYPAPETVAPGASYYTAGKSGRAFLFDGVNDFISVADTAALNLAGDFTIEGWVKATTAGMSGERTIVSKRSADNQNVSYVFFLRNGQIVFSSRSGGGAFAEVVAPGNVTADTWAHVAVTSSNGKLTIYRDGQVSADVSYTATRPVTTEPLNIGGIPAGGVFDGAIDELTFYDVALRPAQIAEIFNTGTTGKPRDDAARQFVLTNDENQLWTYRKLLPSASLSPYNPADASLFSPATTNGNGLSVFGGPPYITHNPTGNPISIASGGTAYTWAVDEVGADPVSQNYSVLRWKAPAAGTFVVSGAFYGRDTQPTTVRVHIFHKATELTAPAADQPDRRNVNSYRGDGVAHTYTISALAGDTVDFIVGSNGDWFYDNTGIAASVVAIPTIPLAAPTNVVIATSQPPITGRLWTFTADHANDLAGLALRVQYALATDPDVWSDLNVSGGTNSMTPPASGSSTWALAVNSLPLAANAYFFRVLATAPNAIDAPTAAIGAEVFGGSGAIAIANPGQPPPPVPDKALPIASELAVKVDGKLKTKVAQGSTFSFLAALDATPDFPTDGDVHVQYSTNPSDANSWQNVIDLEFVGNLAKGRKGFAETTDDVPTTDGLPPGQGLFFRTRTSAPNRITAVGPLKKGVFTPVGPFTIAAGPIWRYISATISTTSDGQGFDVYPGEEITYGVQFKNEGSIAATNVKVTIPVPKGTELVDHDQTNVSSANTRKVVWLIPNVPRGTNPGDDGPEFTKFIKVKVLAAAGSKIAPSLPTVECDQIKRRSASVVGVVKNRDGTLRKSFVTEVLPPLKLTLTGASGNVLPGELLDLTLTAENRANAPITNANVTLNLPAGVFVQELSQQNGTNFDGPALNPPTTGTNPGLTVYGVAPQKIIWNLGTVAANATVLMKFKVRVQYDVPLVRYAANGVTQAPQLVFGFNLNATNDAGKKFAAYKDGTATAFNISGPAAAIRPDLTLTKRALADGKLDNELASQTLPGDTLLGSSFGEVATVIQGQRLVYTLKYSNIGGAAAQKTVLFDEIPTGVAFRGFMRRNGTLIDSDAGITLRDKKKAIIPFQDTARFDSVKFIEIDLGTLGAGGSGEYSYVTQAIGKPNTLVICQNGASVRQLGKKSKQKSGYFLRSESLLVQPLPAKGEALYSLITDAATIDVQQPVITGEFKPGNAIFVDVPYHIGGVGLRFRNVRLFLRVPKGYQLADTGVVGYNAAHLDFDNATGTYSIPRAALAGEAAPVISAADKKGNRQLIFTLRNDTAGTLPGGHNGVVRAVLALPNPVPADLLTTDGYLKEKPRFFVDRAGEREEAQPALRERGGSGLAAFLDMSGTFALPAVRPLPPKQAEPFIGRIAPVSVSPGENVTFTIFFGNATPDGPNAGLGGGELVMGIPPGTQLVEAGTTVFPTAIVPDSANAADDSRYSFPIEYKRDGNLIVWQLGDLKSHGGGAVQLTVHVPAGFIGNKLQDTRCYVRFQNGQPKAPGPITVGVKQSNPLGAIFDAIGGFFSAIGGIFDGQAKDALQPHVQRFDQNSRVISIAGIQALQLDNGVVVIPLLGTGGVGRTMVVGPKSKLSASSFNVVAEDASNLVAIARDNTAGFEIHGLSVSPDGSARPIADVWTPADAVIGLRNASSSLVAAGAGNLVAAGGGNMVAAGGLNLVAAGAGNFVDNSTGQALSIPVEPIYSNMVAAGAGNMVAAGGGNIVAVGNLIGLDGGSLVAAGAGNMVAAGGLNLLPRDEGMMVAAGGGNMVAAGAGNMVAAGGLNLDAADLPTVLGIDKAAMIDLGGFIRDPEVLSTKVDGYLIGLDGGSLIGLDGGSLIGNAGNTLVGNAGNTLVGNAGNTLVGNAGNTIVREDAGN